MYTCPECAYDIKRAFVRECPDCTSKLLWDKVTKSYTLVPEETKVYVEPHNGRAPMGSQALIDHAFGDLNEANLKAIYGDYTLCHHCKNDLNEVTSILGDLIIGWIDKTIINGHFENDRKIPRKMRVSLCHSCYVNTFIHNRDFKVILKSEPNRSTIPQKESSRSITLDRLTTQEMDQVSKDRSQKLKNERESDLFKAELKEIDSIPYEVPTSLPTVKITKPRKEKQITAQGKPSKRPKRFFRS